MKCPSWLAKEAKVIWKRLIPPLERSGALADVDETGLAALCQQIARWRQAEEEVDQYGLTILDESGKRRLNPASRYADGALKQIKALLIQFGFTPRSRGQSTADLRDELDTFLRGE